MSRAPRSDVRCRDGLSMARRGPRSPGCRRIVKILRLEPGPPGNRMGWFFEHDHDGHACAHLLAGGIKRCVPFNVVVRQADLQRTALCAADGLPISSRYPGTTPSAHYPAPSSGRDWDQSPTTFSFSRYGNGSTGYGPYDRHNSRSDGFAPASRIAPDFNNTLCVCQRRRLAIRIRCDDILRVPKRFKQTFPANRHQIPDRLFACR